MEANSGGIVTTALARQLVKNYKENKRKLGKISVNETHAVWFPRKLILDMLELYNPTGKVINGLRMYLAAFPEQQQQPGVPKNTHNLNKLTLVLVQTYKDSGDVTREVITTAAAMPSYYFDNGHPYEQYGDGELCPPPDCPTEGLLMYT